MLQDMKVALFLASSAIKRGNKGTSLVTILIMSLVVINLLFTPSLLDGMDHKNSLQIVETKMGHVVIEPKEGDPLLKDARSLQKKINAFPEVAGTSVHYSQGATIQFEDNSRSHNIQFIDPEDEKTVTQVHEHVPEGDYLSKLDTDEVLVGSETAGRYDPMDESASLGGIIVGDKINIEFRNGISKTSRVKGIFKTKFPHADYGVFLTKREMEDILGTKDLADSIIVRLRTEGIEQDFIRKLTALGINQDIYNSRDRAGFEIGATLGVIKLMLSTIAFLVSVATLFIVIYINAVNKRKIIAIIKAIGVNKRIIIASFIFQALFYASIGVLMGLSILYFILVPYFLAHPLDLPFGMVSLLVERRTVLTAIGYLTLSAVIAGFIPSYQVTKQNITEAMRS